MPKILNLIIASLILFSLNAAAENSSKTITYHFPNDTSLTLTEAPFIKSKQKITYCGDSVCLIDGTPFWGSDGKLPETLLNEITIKIGSSRISLDNTGMFDPLLSEHNQHQFKVEHYYGDTWKVKARFSDGAGAYYAEWLVTKDGAIRTLLGDSELLYDSFNELFNQK